MAQQCDVLVIGAGVIGVCTAHFLVEAGYAPLVVDRGGICAGASHGNAGLIVPSSWSPLVYPGVVQDLWRWMTDRAAPTFMPPSRERRFWGWLARFLQASGPQRYQRSVEALQSLAARSVDLYRALVTSRDLDCALSTRGVLHLSTTREGFRRDMQHALQHRGIGADAVILDREGVRELMPIVTAAVRGGVLYPGDACIAPAAFVQGLADQARQRGARFQEQTEVLHWDTDGDRIRTVHTTQGPVVCDQVVMATGAWSGQLGQAWGLDIPVEPAKGYSYTVPRPDGFPDMPLSLNEPGVSVNPMGDRLRVAGTLEFTGLDDRLYVDRAERIATATKTFLGVDPREGTLEIWRGWRPMTPDGVPVIAWSQRYANLLLATGHNKIGMTLGPVTGEIAARMIKGEKTGFEHLRLDLDRFAARPGDLEVA